MLEYQIILVKIRYFVFPICNIFYILQRTNEVRLYIKKNTILR